MMLRFLVGLTTFLLLLSHRLTEGKEVLPPEAYLNRTIYPALKDYRDRKPEFAMGLLSDLQYADQDEHKRRHFRMSLPKLQHAIAEMNANRTHLDLVFHLGDLVDHSIHKYLPVVAPVLKELRYPFYNVLGNHDYLLTDEKNFELIPAMLNMPARYYSLDAGPSKSYRLVVLDGNDISYYATERNSPKRREADKIYNALKGRRARNANKFNGALGEKQVEWMKKELGGACRRKQRVVILVHHPMRPKDEPTNLWNDIQIVPIIASFHCVAAVINGHAHKLLYDFHYTRYRNVWYITFGGMVQSPFTSFGFADFYPDMLHMHGLIFGRQIELTFNLSYRMLPTDVPTLESQEGEVRPTVVVSSLGPKEVEQTSSAVETFSPLHVKKGAKLEGIPESSGAAVFFWIATLIVVGAMLRRIFRRT